jgi:hypothetical protein
MGACGTQDGSRKANPRSNGGDSRPRVNQTGSNEPVWFIHLYKPKDRFKPLIFTPLSLSFSQVLSFSLLFNLETLTALENMRK